MTLTVDFSPKVIESIREKDLFCFEVSLIGVPVVKVSFCISLMNSSVQPLIDKPCFEMVDEM